MKGFGDLLKALRQGNFDQHGNCITREQLSSSLHFSPHQLGRLERGERSYLDNQTLQLLAQAFKLSDQEHREFFYAATEAALTKNSDHDDPVQFLNELVALLEKLRMPAFIKDVYGDIIAANNAVVAFYGLTPEILASLGRCPAGNNSMYIIHSSALGMRDLIGEAAWKKGAEVAMLFFRRSTLRYRHTAYFDYLLRELLKEPSFDIAWYCSHRMNNHIDPTYYLTSFVHPVYGSLKFLVTETIVSSITGNLYLIIYNPGDSTTSSAFSVINKEYGTGTISLAPWPEKAIRWSGQASQWGAKR